MNFIKFKTFTGFQINVSIFLISDLSSIFYNPLLYSSALLWPQFLLSSASTLGSPHTPITPKSPLTITNNRDYALTPEKEDISGSSQDECHNEDMPLNLSIKREENSMESANTPPLKAISLKSSPRTPDNEEQEYERTTKRRTHGAHIWSPASMCEKSMRYQNPQQQQQQHPNTEEESDMDPIVRKFKYERRNSYSRQQQQLQDSGLLTPLSSLSGPATYPRTSTKSSNDVELAQQQIYAHRNAFMAGLAGNNLELLTQHLKAQTQRDLELLRQQRVDLFIQQNSDNDDSNNGDLASNDDYQQQQQQFISQQQQQQHPDSTALIGSLTDVRLSSSTGYQDSDGGGSTGTITIKGEKRTARNFQVNGFHIFITIFLFTMLEKGEGV